MNGKPIVVLGAAALAGLLSTSCNSSDNCIVAAACCQLNGSDTDPVPDCEGDDVEEWGDDLGENGLEEEDGVLRLKPDTVTRVPVVWVTSTDEQKVAQYDLTGQELFRVPTWGYFPNRTAVTAEGGVWITNRDSGSYIKINVDGTVFCSSDYSIGQTRAAAIDANQVVWIGLYDVRQVIKVHPTETEGTVTVMDPSSGMMMDVPKCKELARIDLATTAPYGLAGDSQGNVWVGTLGGGTVAKIDAVNDVLLGEYDIYTDPMVAAAGSCWSMYGMVIDLDDNPWFANIGCGNVIKVDKATGAVTGIFTGGPDGMLSPRAAGIDRNGHIWVAENGAQYVDEFEPDGTWVKRVDVGCGNTYPGTLGTGSDLDGNMWTVLQYLGKVVKYTTDGEVLGCYPEDSPDVPLLAGPYTYSDLTGSTLALVTSSLGRWRGRVSRDYALEWLAVTFKATTPPGTSVCVRVRASTTLEGLDGAIWTEAWCDVVQSPETTIYDISSLPNTPFLEIELQLSSQEEGVTPTVAKLSVAAKRAE